MSMKELQQLLGKNSGAIHQYAFKHGIKKPEDYQRKNNVEILLNDDLQTMYWIGVLLADGHFHKKGGIVRLDAASQDMDRLESFRQYVNSQPPIGIHKTSKSTHQDKCRVTCTHVKAIAELREKYQISSRKTYEPPDFTQYNLTDVQWIALIIGFIDGDGYIQLADSGKNNDYNRIKINIEVHSSWLNNLTFIKTKLYSIFSDLSRMALPKINANKLASTQIANREVTDGLHTFIITHNLDVMQRKWNKFNEVKRFNTHTMH